MIKINVRAGHCEQFEQKCQISLELVFRYSERLLVEGVAYVACSIIPVENSGYIGFSFADLYRQILFLVRFHPAYWGKRWSKIESVA